MRNRVLQTVGEFTTIPLSIAQRVVTVFEAVGRYIWMSVDWWHPTSQIGVVGEPRVGFVALGLVSSFAVAIALVRFRPRPSAFAMATITTGVIPLLLVIHLVPMPWIAVVGDRLAYLPWAIASCGFAVAISKLQTGSPRLRRWVLILPGILLVTLIPRVRQREHIFGDEVDFWIDAVATTAPSNWGPSVSLSGLYLRGGWPQRSLPIAESLERRCPPPLRLPLGSTRAKALWRMGDYRRALENVERSNASQTPENLLMSARLKLSLRDVEGAEGDCRRSLQLYSHYWDAEQFLNTVARVKRVSSELAQANPGLQKRTLEAQNDMLSGRLVEAEQEWLKLLSRQDLPTPTAEEGFAFICEFGSAAGVKQSVSIYRHRPDFRAVLATGCADRLRLAERLDSQWLHVVGILKEKNSNWGHCRDYGPFSD